MQNSRKPGICILLTVLNGVLPYIGYTMTPCIQNFVHVMIHTYVVFDPRRTLFDYGEQIKVNVKIAA